MKVIVIGATGQLGKEVLRELELRHDRGQDVEAIGLAAAACDVKDAAQVMAWIARERPDAVVHCAAYTRATLAEYQPEESWALNVDGTRNVALACRKYNVKLMYISAGYVYSDTGDTPKSPDDSPNPSSVFGMSKLAGELAVRSISDKYFIVRVSHLFGFGGKNFVNTMLDCAKRGVKKVYATDDQIGSPTYTRDAAKLICDMLETEKYGIYNATNMGVCSWAELAETIFKYAGADVQVERIKAEDNIYGSKIPGKCLLSKDKLTENGFELLPPWEDAVRRYIEELAKR